jgi:hypothetical protein
VLSVEVQELAQRVKTEVDAFEEAPAKSRRVLREMMVADPRAFCVAALPVLREGIERPGVAFIYDLLADKAMLPLCDPSLLSLDDDVAIARGVMRREPLLDVKLARRITTAGREATEIDPDVALRTLEVAGAISDGARIVPMLIQMLREPDPRLRSKAALLVGRINKSTQWAEQLLKEPDARVRANCVEALWSVENPAVREVLWQAVKDPNNRVQGNALLGLHRLGDGDVIEPLQSMTRHSSPVFRGTAAWVMGESGDPRFQPTLAQMIRETDVTARHAVFHALARIKQSAARFQELPQLQVALCQQWVLSDGSHRVHAAIALPDGAEIPHLPPTNVVLWQNQRLVNKYKVQKPHPPDWIVAGIALPAKRVCSSDIEALLEVAVRGWISKMSGSERAMILRFATRDANNPEEQEFRPPPPGPLLAEPIPLSNSLEDLENRYLYPDSVQTLFNTVSIATGSKNILLLEDRSGRSAQPDVHPARWTTLVREAQNASVTMNAIVLLKPGQPPGTLLEITTQTGGLFMGVHDPGDLATAVEKLHFGLLHPFEITFSHGEQGLAPLRLQVYTKDGCGEDSLG